MDPGPDSHSKEKSMQANTFKRSAIALADRRRVRRGHRDRRPRSHDQAGGRRHRGSAAVVAAAPGCRRRAARFQRARREARPRRRPDQRDARRRARSRRATCPTWTRTRSRRSSGVLRLTADAAPGAVARAGLGLHRRRERRDPHQRARRRRRRRSDGPARRQARVQGEGPRHRQDDRHRGDQDRRRATCRS